MPYIWDHTRHIKLHERSKVLMVHDFINKKIGSYFSIRNMAPFPDIFMQ
jgi:hypothetical protein